MLDTSVCIELLRGTTPPKDLQKRITFLSSIVETELWAGVFHVGGEKERIKLNLLLENIEVLPFDSAAAQKTGQILAHLTGQGLPIGDFDTQIAGHALAAKLPLVTSNLKHFQRVPQLKIIPWP